MNSKIFSTKDVLARLNVAPATLWRMRRDGLFPRPIKISDRRIGWPLHIIEEWERKRIAEAGHIREDEV